MGIRLSLLSLIYRRRDAIGVSIHMAMCTIFKDYAESGLLLPLIPTSHPLNLRSQYDNKGIVCKVIVRLRDLDVKNWKLQKRAVYTCKETSLLPTNTCLKLQHKSLGKPAWDDSRTQEIKHKEYIDRKNAR